MGDLASYLVAQSEPETSLQLVGEVGVAVVVGAAVDLDAREADAAPTKGCSAPSLLRS
jgi:hypothetical protein